MGRLDDRIALITGGARGIGRAIAEAMVAAGATVIVTDLDHGAVAETANAIGGTAHKLDVSDAAACATLAKAVSGPISILVNNAGVIFPGYIHDAAAEAQWAKTLEVNVGGAFNMVRAFHGQLKQTKGAVVNIASIRSFVAASNAAAYAASKGAVMQFTKALAVEWGEDGVRVNAIAPGFIETGLVPADQKTPERQAAILARTPLKRIGDPSDVGGAAVFLASDEARFITGAILAVDGGYLAA